MDDMICAIDSIYYSTINDISFDVSNKKIKFELTLKEDETITHHTMQFENVTSFLWIEKQKDSQEYSFSECEYYELTSVIIDKTITNTEDVWLKQYPMEYNVAIEIWETALLINATELSIDNQHFKLPR